MRLVLAGGVAVVLHTLCVLGQRHQGDRGGSGGGSGGGGFLNHGGGDSPNTFITVTSGQPAAATGNATPSRATSSAPSIATGASSVSSSGSVDASLIPPFGITAGIEANDGTANCVGLNGKGIPYVLPSSQVAASDIEQMRLST